MKIRIRLLLFGLVVAAASPLMAQLTVALSPNVGSPQPLGSSVVWTANVSGDPDPNPSYEYQFTGQPVGYPSQVRRGYGHSKTFTLTPSAFETTFTVAVTVKNVHAGTSASKTANFQFTSRLVSGHAAVYPTNHPLVAFFAAQACQVPNLMRVRFTPVSGVPAGGISGPTLTNPIPCRFNTTSAAPDGTSMNFYIAGMYPNATYKMHWEVLRPNGTVFNVGSDFNFTTGAIPANVFTPVLTPVGSSTDTGEPLVVHNVVTLPVNGHILTSVAADLAGNVIWYAPIPPTRTEVGGNQWGFVPGSDPYLAGIAESDLAGNIVVQTTVGAVNEQLVAMGKRPITALHHEVRRIITPTGAAPGGYIVALGASEQVTTTAQGGTTQVPVDVMGDQIIVMDQNFNVKWTWDAFNFLDINHTAILNEQCFQPGGGGCEPFDPNFNVANDWLHTNSIQYNPYDGNFIISIRHQDSVLKVAFGNGAGDGHVIWRLGNGTIGGPGGTLLPTFTLFTVGASGPDLGFPSFSHSHDAEIELNGQQFNGFRVLTIFDDGNTRQAIFNPNAHSRCQIWALDEANLVANLNTNGDATTYAFALGSAQLLKNGNVHCDAGIPNSLTAPPSTVSVEVDQAGNFVYSLNAVQDSYRSFRMQDLYTAITP